MHRFYRLLPAALFLSITLTACTAAVVGGIAATSAVVMDKRTADALLKDQNIKLRFARLYQEDPDLTAKSHVNVTSYNRRMLITGEVPDEQTKQALETLARQVPDVRAVFNEVVIGSPTSFSSRSNDSYLTSKIKTDMLTSNSLSGAQIKIITENASVFLMGLVTRKHADIAVDITRTTPGVRRVVKIFEYVAEPVPGEN